MRRPAAAGRKQRPSRKATCKKRPAVLDKKQADKLEFQRLKNALKSWRNRGKPGAADLMKQLSACSSSTEKLAFLQAKVVTKEKRGPWTKASNADAAISSHSEAESVEFARLAMDTVVKRYKNQSVPMQRTLSVYGYLREIGAESTAPVPQILKVEVDGKHTTLTFERKGPDYSQFSPVDVTEYRRLRDLSKDELIELGLSQRLSTHAKNWSLVRDGTNWRAFLLDLGKASIAESALRKTRAIRSKLKL